MNGYEDYAPNVTPWGPTPLDDEEQRERERQELATHPPVWEYVPKGSTKQRMLAEFDAMADNAYKALTSGSGLDRVIAAAAFRLRGTREEDNAQVQAERSAVREQAIGNAPQDDPYSAWASDDPYDRWAADSSLDEMAQGRAEMERLRAGGVPQAERPGFEVPGQSVGNVAGTLGHALNPFEAETNPNSLFGTAAPEGSNPAVQELLRPANYVGVGSGVRGLVRGAASGVGARFASDAAVEALPEDANPWLTGGVGFAAGLVGGVAGFGAPEIASGARRAVGAADAALNPADLRGAAPEAFQRGRGNYFDDELVPNAVRPDDMVPRRGAIVGAAERTGPPSEREIAALKARIAKEGLTPELKALNIELLGRQLGAMTPEAQAAAAPWNAPAPPPTIPQALRGARIEENATRAIDSPQARALRSVREKLTRGDLTPADRAQAGSVEWRLEDSLGIEHAYTAADGPHPLPAAARYPGQEFDQAGAAARVQESRAARRAAGAGEPPEPLQFPTQGGMLGTPDVPTLRPENTPIEQQGAMFDRAKFKRPAPKVPEFPLFGEGQQGGALDTMAPTNLSLRIPREQWVSPSEIDTRPDLFQARDAPAGQATDPRRVKQIVDNFDPELFEPLTVVREGDRYVVISGHHRLEAARQLGSRVPEIPVRVISGDISNPASRIHLQNQAAIANFLVAEPNIREVWRAARQLEVNGEDLVSTAKQMRMTTDKVQRALDIGSAGPAVLERAVSVPQTADIAAEVGRGVRLYGITQEDAFALFDAYATRAKGERPLSAAAVRRQIDRLAPELGKQEGLPGFEASETGAPVFEAMREAARVQDELLKAERRATANLRGVTNLAKESGIEAPGLTAAGEAKLVEIRARLQDVEAEAVARIREQRAAAQAARAVEPAAVVGENLGPQQTGAGLFDGQSAGNAAVGSVPETSISRLENPVSRVQAPALNSSTQPTPPSSTARSGVPSTMQRSEIRPFGIDPSSHKPILHDRGDAQVLINVARAAAPQLESSLDQVAATLGGAIVGPRVKSEASLAAKLARGVNPATSSDYLGARLVVPDIDSAYELMTAGKRVVADDISQRYGYQARHVSVEVTPGFTAEVQIMEPRIAAAQEFAHVYYDRLTKSGQTFQPDVEARLVAAGQYLYEHAPAVTPERAAEIQRAYQAGNHVPPPELSDVVREANRIATGAAIEPSAASYVDVRPGAAHPPLGPLEADALAAGPTGMPAATAQDAQRARMGLTPRSAVTPPPPPRTPVAAAGAPPTPPRPPRPPAPSGYGAMPTNGPQGGLPGMPTPPPPPRTWADTFSDIVSAPLSAKTTYDLSAPGRQLAPMLYAHPTAIDDVLRAQTRALRSQAAFDASQEALRTAPHANLRDIAGVELSGITDGFLREEQIGSRLAAKVLPGSQRFNDAYSAAINEGRDWLFRNMLANVDPALLTEAGLRNGGAAELKEIGRIINASTGRGDLAKAFTNKTSGILWAPKLLAGRVQLITSIASSNPQVRREAARQVLAFAGINVAVLGMIKASGVADVELDPRSSDWGTVRIGNRRIDPWAGYKPLVNLVARLGVSFANTVRDGEDIPNMKMVNRPGAEGRLYSKPALDVVTQFLRTKLAPLPGEGINQLAGKDVTGAKVTKPLGGAGGEWAGRGEHALAGLLAPIFLESIAEELAYTFPRGMATGGAAGGARAVGEAVVGNAPYFLGAGGGYYTPDAAQKAAEGGYRNLDPAEKFEARDAETWRYMSKLKDINPPISQYGSREAWSEAKRTEFEGKFARANPTWPDERVIAEAAKAVNRHAVNTMFLEKRRELTDQWVKRYPREAQKRYGSLTDAQRESLDKALGAVVP